MRDLLATSAFMRITLPCMIECLPKNTQRMFGQMLPERWWQVAVGRA